MLDSGCLGELSRLGFPCCLYYNSILQLLALQHLLLASQICMQTDLMPFPHPENIRSSVSETP